MLFLCWGRGVQNHPNNTCGGPCKNQDTYHYVFLYYDILVFLYNIIMVFALGNRIMNRVAGSTTALFNLSSSMTRYQVHPLAVPLPNVLCR